MTWIICNLSNSEGILLKQDEKRIQGTCAVFAAGSNVSASYIKLSKKCSSHLNDPVELRIVSALVGREGLRPQDSLREIALVRRRRGGHRRRGHLRRRRRSGH